MTRRPAGRCLIQLTMQPELYQEIRDHCQRLDVPMTVWARDLIRRELAQPIPPTPLTDV
jgi:hypothetical protein